jgi:hypothetical protein
MWGALHEDVIAFRIVDRDACSSTVLNTTCGYVSLVTLSVVRTLLTATYLAQRYTEVTSWQQWPSQRVVILRCTYKPYLIL